jgi:hypothetical protein
MYLVRNIKASRFEPCGRINEKYGIEGMGSALDIRQSVSSVKG